MRLSLQAGLLVGLVAAGGPAAALELQVRVGADLRWFDWREYQGGAQLLMERGPQAAPVVGLQLQQGGAFASVEALWGGGMARYDGHLQSGQPYEANAWEEIIETEWRLGWQSGRGRVHVGWLQRDWRRFIDGSATVSSAEERYRWRLITLGGEGPLPHSARWRVALNIGLPESSHQKVYSVAVDDFTLEPGGGLLWRLSFPYRAAPDQPLSLEPYYQEQYMDRSEAVRLTVGGVPQGQFAYQPESMRRELGLTLRWELGRRRLGD